MLFAGMRGASTLHILLFLMMVVAALAAAKFSVEVVDDPHCEPNTSVSSIRHIPSLCEVHSSLPVSKVHTRRFITSRTLFFVVLMSAEVSPPCEETFLIKDYKIKKDLKIILL